MVGRRGWRGRDQTGEETPGPRGIRPECPRAETTPLSRGGAAAEPGAAMHQACHFQGREEGATAYLQEALGIKSSSDMGRVGGPTPAEAQAVDASENDSDDLDDEVSYGEHASLRRPRVA